MDFRLHRDMRKGDLAYCFPEIVKLFSLISTSIIDDQAMSNILYKIFNDLFFMIFDALSIQVGWFLKKRGQDVKLGSYLF